MLWNGLVTRLISGSSAGIVFRMVLLAMLQTQLPGATRLHRSRGGMGVISISISRTTILSSILPSVVIGLVKCGLKTQLAHLKLLRARITSPTIPRRSRRPTGLLTA